MKEKKKTKHRRARWGQRFWRALGLGLLLAAVGSELRKPAAERTWHGKLANFVPYDLRRPTMARFRERLWNPEERHLLVPRVFGVGWTINLRKLLGRWLSRPASKAA